MPPSPYRSRRTSYRHPLTAARPVTPASCRRPRRDGICNTWPAVREGMVCRTIAEAWLAARSQPIWGERICQRRSFLPASATPSSPRARYLLADLADDRGLRADFRGVGDIVV